MYDNYYLKLSKKEQYWLLILALWDKINWYRLNEYSLSGRPDWTYKSRYLCALFFSLLDIDEWLSYKDLVDLFDNFHGDPNIFSPTCGFNLFWFFRKKLFSLFHPFGLFNINFIRRKDSRYKDLKLKITTLGNYIFTILPKSDNI